MKETRFLKDDTRGFAVFASVVCSIALILLVIIGLFSNRYLTVAGTGSIVLALVCSMMCGALQLRVFADYKRRAKLLRADGILHICLTVLIALITLIWVWFNATSDDTMDLRYVIGVFLLAFAAWKVFAAAVAFLRKYRNAFAEALVALTWVGSGVFVLMLPGAVSDTPRYLLSVTNYALVALTIFYMLFSYEFGTPDYLETPEGIAQLEREMAERQVKLDRINARYASRPYAADAPAAPDAPVASNSAQDPVAHKLEQLRGLREKGLITEEEYEKKKQEILSEL